MGSEAWSKRKFSLTFRDYMSFDSHSLLANLVGSQPSRRVMTTQQALPPLSLLMTPWVAATVSELCKTPRPASACDVRAAATLGSCHAVLARTVCGSRDTVDTITPMHTHTRPHTQVPLDAHLSHTTCSWNRTCGQNQLRWWLDAPSEDLCPSTPGQQGCPSPHHMAAPKQ